MKKTFSTIAAMLMLLLTASSYSSSNSGTEVGEFAPSLKVCNDSTTADLSQMQGKYVLLTFWTSADAASRINCKKYDAWMEANNPTGLRHVSVNFDKEPTLFEEIAKRDGLDAKSQFNVRGKEAAKIIRDFRLADGYGTMLIAPDGRIAKINPNPSDLQHEFSSL